MSDDFDPYQKWLGIPAQEQPPNYYRLLTLKPFEADLDVIGNTSAKLIAYLQTRSKGKNAAHALRLLEEVTAARACLLAPQSKAEYDAALRSPGEEPEETMAAVVEPVAAKAAGGRTSGSIPVAQAIIADDPPAEAAPVDDMSFLDGLHYSSPSPTAASSAGQANKSSAAPFAGAAVGKATAKVPAASAGKRKLGAAPQPANGAAKPGVGVAKKNGKWQPQPWQIGAMIGGGALLLIAVVAVVAMTQSSPEPEKPRNNTVAQVEEAPRFGPGTVDTAAMQAEVAAKRKIPVGRSSASVPLRRVGDFFLTEVTLNGQPAGTFLVDTGAAATAIKSSVAQRLNLPDGDKPQGVRAVGGAQKASFKKIDTLNVGDAKFTGVQAIVIDLQPWEKAVGTSFDGVIGCDVWRELMFCIDPEQKRLTFYDRDIKNPISVTAEFLTIMDNRPFITVRLDNGKEVEYMAATGCSHQLMHMPEKGAGQGGAGDPATPEGESQQVGAVKLLGQSLDGLSAVTGRSDDPYITSDPRQEGVVGGSILANYKLVMDFQRNKVAAVRIKGK